MPEEIVTHATHERVSRKGVEVWMQSGQISALFLRLLAVLAANQRLSLGRKNRKRTQDLGRPDSDTSQPA
jgi:hypothetical protein